MTDMDQYIEKANTLVEALPYIKQFRKKIVVVKYGGSFMSDQDIKYSVMDDIALMKLVGIRPIVVHGGGKDISNMLNKLNIQSTFYDGLRITDKATVDVAEMVLCGKINKEIVQLLENRDIHAVGISGKDSALLKVHKKKYKDKDLGYVGEVEKVNVKFLQDLIKNDYIPVIAPIGCDANKETYNINADHVACAVAKALHAEKLIYLTDTDGVYLNPDDPNSIIRRLNIEEANNLINRKIISGGMIPKVENALDSILSGVNSVHILDGTIEHSILLELFTAAGCGTMIKEK
ncbi:acetylglutamate kinase [Pseudoramibacter sp.]|jgi:acetylglutamate kinase|uniref:acetylglutamate kinase n=1 Tax=Pseudoramibacter sp. TaxID=2034862 RepID=UPI0025ECB87D|nr:acetylglutamate kinase [Pseudoramibacter sp.]MCH4072870.1 acetylglutamate kinase [Pseudoramibacter sp.]MCH4106641.1 acetylglutamate kinase [Pseudoramibacter sp.]